jgi:hypothetical protein
MTVNDFPKSLIALYLILIYGMVYISIAYPISQLKRVYAKVF